MSFLKMQLDPLSVGRIFISHTHPDHVCELPLFVQLVYLKGRTEKLEIYLPAEFEEIFSRYLYAVYLFKERLPFELQVIGYKKEFEFDGTFKLKAIQTGHFKRYAEHIEKLKLPNQMQCHSFLIEANDKKLLYLADIDSFADIEEYLDGCFYAVVESTHIDMKEFLKVAPHYRVNRYIISHLGSPEEVALIREAIQNSGVDNVFIAEDGMELTL